MPLLATLAAALSGKASPPWTDTIALDEEPDVGDAPPPDEGPPTI